MSNDTLSELEEELNISPIFIEQNQLPTFYKALVFQGLYNVSTTGDHPFKASGLGWRSFQHAYNFALEFTLSDSKINKDAIKGILPSIDIITPIEITAGEYLAKGRNYNQMVVGGWAGKDAESLESSSYRVFGRALTGNIWKEHLSKVVKLLPNTEKIFESQLKTLGFEENLEDTVLENCKSYSINSLQLAHNKNSFQLSYNIPTTKLVSFLIASRGILSLDKFPPTNSSYLLTPFGPIQLEDRDVSGLNNLKNDITTALDKLLIGKEIDKNKFFGEYCAIYIGPTIEPSNSTFDAKRLGGWNNSLQNYSPQMTGNSILIVPNKKEFNVSIRTDFEKQIMTEAVSLSKEYASN